MTGATLDFRHPPDGTVVTVRGDVDSANANALLAAIERRLFTGRDARAILDISDVDYFDSAGVNLVFRLARRLAGYGSELVVVAPPTSIAGAALRHANAGSAVVVADAVPAAAPSRPAGPDD
ncbi:STAS domain-containing protein [Paraconexibacter antarcticus]|uniref:STAS domain-containing protein n=1 Tax=Paraconexibacter antarcticus TaxID=2949664 RepID=A0ABY5DWF3_9ACTN|nr:STAS domain-containing protein [Paraconexibacter antarcticus]UTI65192.1 STAS domain-containing protein [Paraconexibacter antarcticus]